MRSYLARFAFRGDEVFAPICGPLRGREGEADARRRDAAAAQPAAPGRADQPPRPRLARGAGGVARGLSGLDRLRLARPRLHRPSGHPGARPAGRPGDAAAGQLLGDRRGEGAASRSPGLRRGRGRRRLRSRRRAGPPAAGDSAETPASSRRPARRPDSAEEKEAGRRRRKIKSLEEKIAALEKEIEALESRLWEEALTLGPVEAHRIASEKAARSEELDRLVEEWAALSEEEGRAARSERP